MKLHLPSTLLVFFLSCFQLTLLQSRAVEVPEGYTSYYLAEPDELRDFATGTENIAFLLDGSVTITPSSATWWTSSKSLMSNGSILFTIEEDGDPYTLVIKDAEYLAFRATCLRVEDIGHVTFSNIGDVSKAGGAINSTELQILRNKSITISNNATYCGPASYSSNSLSYGGAIYGGNSSTINICDNTGSITICGNYAESHTYSTYAYSYGGAIYGDSSSTINISDNTSSINISDNYAQASDYSYGGAICGNDGSTINISGNTGKIFISGNYAYTTNASRDACGGAIYSNGSVAIQNNESVVFDRNYERCGHSYRLRSIYLDSVNSDGGSLQLSAAEGKVISFFDSVYVTTCASGQTVNVVFNGSCTAGDDSEIAQGGDIIFDGSQVEGVLTDLLNASPSDTQIKESQTSYIGGITNLKSGRLIVQNGAKYNGLGISTTSRSGAAVVLKDAGMEHSSGSINIRRGTSLELSGANQITAGTLSLSSGSTVKFTVDSEQKHKANLTLTSVFEHFSFGIALDGQEMLDSGRYKLVELADATQYVDGSYWNADDITVTATGDAAGLGFDDLVWEDGVLYVEQGKSIWTNAGGDGSWNTTSTNWSRNGLGITYRDGMDVLFDGTAAGTVQLEGEISPLSVVVENSAGHDYTFTGSGKLTGATSLTKTGTGELSLATANEHTGGTRLNGGSLRVQHSSALGATTATLSTAAASRLSIENGAQVVLAAAEGNDLAGSVSIAVGASLEMQGSGYRAESTQLAGELVFNGSGVSQQAGSLSGSGSLRVTGSQTSVNMSSLDAYTGSLSVTGVGSQLSVGSGNYIGDGILQVSATGAEMNLCNSAVKIQKDGKLSVGNGATFSASAINVQNGSILEALKTDTSLSLSEVLLSNASQHEIKTQKFEYTGAFDAEAACNDFSSTLIAQVEGITIESGTTYHAASSNLNLAGCALTFSKGHGNPYISLVMELDDTYIAAETQIVLFSGVASFNIGEAVHQDSDTVYVFAAKDYLQGDYVFETTALVYDGNVGVVYLVEAVPEPTTVTLSLLALAALAARRRRK